MKSKILIAGFALASVFAVAQSSSNTADAAKKSSDDKQAREAATGKASGKVTPDKVEAGTESLKTAREASTGMATGKAAKTSANDDWQAKRVAAGDVNGDGKADAAAASSTDQKPATASQTDVNSPRDMATGQASGKRQHQPVSLQKVSDTQDSDKKDPNKK